LHENDATSSEPSAEKSDLLALGVVRPLRWSTPLPVDMSWVDFTGAH